ncbi:hypothetical protein K488DRAFT_87555 [Vararia minispora EC-137]|uniref:Uncharacterized protein n=1 Tax=Vararia minispora EC-137 TaxID=1314806 RepID=A0ACB8QGC9_9AGAM|nr:hypothetical protein K488DRAFT_87555 [Vararia minispora EC-137]
MFSFRSVVEGLANPQPHPPRRGSEDKDGAHDRSNSTGSGTLELPFSESLSNLRKSFAPARTATPPPAPSVTSSPGTPDRPAKRRLEDRLRASFAIGDASDHSTPAVSSRASPAPFSDTSSPPSDTPPAPESIPLPSSPPILSPQESIAPAFDPSSLPHPLATPPVPLAPLPRLASEVAAGSVSDESSTSQPERVPLPLSPDVEEFASPLDAAIEELSRTASSPSSPVTSESTIPNISVTMESVKLVEDAGHRVEKKHSPDGPVEDRPHSDPKEDVPLSVPLCASTEVATSAVTLTAAEGISRPVTPELPLASPAIPGDIGAIQERLRLVEQRFSDVSTSFKRLQAEKLAADKVLQELTSVQTVQDASGLRDFLQNSQLKVEMAQDEIRRLTGKLTRQEERIEEVRETHRLEGHSQTALIDNLRRQIEEAEALVAASTGSSSEAEKELVTRKAELEKAHVEMEKLKATVKEEEEKRIKAVSLLKTVRQKLVKAEKDRDDALKDVVAGKEREKETAEREREERAKVQAQLGQAKSERDSAVANLKNQYEREIATLKEKNEIESTYESALNTKNARIAGLENSVQTLSAEKNSLFDQLQLRQAEVESSQSHLEVLQSQNTELQFQIREYADRLALVQEELADARREHESRVRSPASSSEDVARMLAAAETRYEAKLADVRRKLQLVEKERAEVEADWSRKLEGKTREAEKWKRAVDSSARNREDSDAIVGRLREELEKVRQEAAVHRAQAAELQMRNQERAEAEHDAKSQVADLKAKATALEQQVEEAKAREVQARAQNKTLREELRKVQSSAALLERSRNPGVGYWSTRQESTGDAVKSPPAASPTRVGSPTPSQSSITGTPNDEEVNLEYLRNVILQFLEHKEMRPNLVRVLSIILRFTPQETRRLIAKV